MTPTKLLLAFAAAALCMACSGDDEVTSRVPDASATPNGGADAAAPNEAEDGGFGGAPDAAAVARDAPDQVPACTPELPILDPVARECISREEGYALCHSLVAQYDSSDPNDPTCGADCICTWCSRQQLLCLGHAGCRAIIECGTAANCVGSACVTPCADVYTANGGTDGVAAQLSGNLSNCLNGGGCARRCSSTPIPDSGASDGGPADVSNDAAVSDPGDASPDAADATDSAPADGSSDAAG